MNTIKKLIFTLALSLGAVLVSSAETIKVFALNINQLPNGGFSPERKEGINSMLNSQGVDLGFFYNMKAASYFNLVNDAYAFTANSDSKLIFAHNKAKYDFVEDLGGFGSHANCCVVKDKTDQYYAIVLAHNSNSSQAFDVTSDSKCKGYNEKIRAAITAAGGKYPGARVFVTYVEGFAVQEEALKLYLMNGPYSLDSQYPPLGLSVVADGNGIGGGIYTFKDAAVAEMSGEPVNVENETFKAIVGTVTYASTVNVTFKDSLSDEIEIVPVAVGGDATPPEPWDHTDSGYDFTGWEGDYTSVTEDCEVTAQYAIRKYTVQFVTVDETVSPATTNVIDTQTIDWGNAAEAPTPPAIDGFKFIRWDPEDFSSIKSDLTVVARYEELSNIFHVRFLDSDGVTVLKEEDVIGGKAATAPDDPTPKSADMLFYGWSPADFSAITENTDIVAVYGPKTREVATIEDLVAVVASANKLATIKLTEDLDFSDIDYTPVDLVSTFDGKGHTISNLKTALFGTVTGTVKDLRLLDCSREFSAIYGVSGALLADRVEGGTISGIVVENGLFTSKKSTCGLATIAFYVKADAEGHPSMITNCVAKNCVLKGVEANVLGGLVGELSEACEVVDCRFLVDDKTATNLYGNVQVAGGVVAKIFGAKICGCYAEGIFQAKSGQNTASAGGIVGLAGETKVLSEVVSCTNAAAVAFLGNNGAAGGIVGRIVKQDVLIKDCLNTGSNLVSFETPSGEGVGAGGIIGAGWGTLFRVTIIGSKNEGAITSEDIRPAGGIIGALEGSSASPIVSMTNTFNYGSVISPVSAGGLVGRLVRCYGAGIYNSGNIGSVSCPTNTAAGLIGQMDYYGNNTAFVIENVLQNGKIATDSGIAVEGVGVITNGWTKNYLKFQTAVFAGSLVAGDSGKTAALVGDLKVEYGTSKVTIVADENCRIQGETLPLYYDMNGEPKAVVARSVKNNVIESEEPVPTMDAAFLTRKSGATKLLNDIASAKGYMSWVRAKNGPELSLFGVPYVSGLVFIIE